VLQQLVLKDLSDKSVEFSAEKDMKPLLSRVQLLISAAGFEKLFEILSSKPELSETNHRFLTFLSWCYCPHLQIPFFPSSEEFQESFLSIVNESPLSRVKEVSTLSSFALFILSPDFLPESIWNFYSSKLRFDQIIVPSTVALAQATSAETAYSVSFCKVRRARVSLELVQSNSYVLTASTETEEARVLRVYYRGNSDSRSR
jgi:hypothetical protein